MNENQIAQVFGQIAQYPIKIEQDGTFTIPVIPEGHYRFQIAFIGTAAGSSYVADIRQGVFSVYDNGLTVGTLSLWIRQVVIDKTGLDGLYDYDTGLWRPEDPGPNFTAEVRADPDTLPTIFTALQERLGLRLESQRAEVVLVIDSADKPK